MKVVFFEKNFNQTTTSQQTTKDYYAKWDFVYIFLFINKDNKLKAFYDRCTQQYQKMIEKNQPNLTNR